LVVAAQLLLLLLCFAVTPAAPDVASIEARPDGTAAEEAAAAVAASGDSTCGAAETVGRRPSAANFCEMPV
jgi:hypothetical protein